MKKLTKLNSKKIIDGVIAAVTVENAPIILSKFGLPATGLTGNISAAALTYILAMLLKKEDVANVGIALALGKIVSDVGVQPLLNSILPATQNKTLQNYANLQNYAKLKDYVPKPKIVRNYAAIYS